MASAKKHQQRGRPQKSPRQKDKDRWDNKRAMREMGNGSKPGRYYNK